MIFFVCKVKGKKSMCLNLVAVWLGFSKWAKKWIMKLANHVVFNTLGFRYRYSLPPFQLVCGLGKTFIFFLLPA